MKNFKRQLDAKRQAAQSAEAVEKDPSAMTPEELDAALERAEEQLRQAKEGQLRAGRAMLTERGRPVFLGGRRKRRPYWK